MKKILMIGVLILPFALGACHKKPASVIGGGENGGGSIKGLKTVYFDFDDANIRADQTSVLDANASYLKSNSSRVTVEGNCDERGTNEYNMALGDRRARGTKNYLINLGVDSSRLNTISYGEERPAAACHDESCWSQNRRADFVK